MSEEAENQLVDDLLTSLLSDEECPEEFKNKVEEEKKIVEEQIDVTGQTRFLPVALLAGAQIIPWLVGIAKGIAATVGTTVAAASAETVATTTATATATKGKGILGWAKSKFSKWFKRKAFDLEVKLDKPLGLSEDQLTKLGDSLRNNLEEKTELIERLQESEIAEKIEDQLGYVATDKGVTLTKDLVTKGKEVEEKVEEEIAELIESGRVPGIGGDSQGGGTPSLGTAVKVAKTIKTKIDERKIEDGVKAVGVTATAMIKKIMDIVKSRKNPTNKRAFYVGQLTEVRKKYREGEIAKHEFLKIKATLHREMKNAETEIIGS